jgi:hypothetical protein
LAIRDPLINLGTQEAPVAAQAKPWQVASFEQFVDRGGVTLQVRGDLGQRYHLRFIAQCHVIRFLTSATASGVARLHASALAQTQLWETGPACAGPAPFASAARGVNLQHITQFQPKFKSSLS